MARSRAFQFAEDMGLSQMAQKVDDQFIQSMLDPAFNRLQGESRRSMDEVGFNFLGRGMSGAGSEGKAFAAVASDIASRGMSEYNQAYAKGEEQRQKFFSTWLNTLMHEDQYQQKERQLDMMEPDLIDTIGRLSSIGFSFMG